MKGAFILIAILLLLLASLAAADPGDTLWTRTYGGSSDDYGQCVQQATDGGYIIAGYTASFGAGGSDFYLVKTDANGGTLWARTYGGSSDEEGRSVQQSSDDGYIVAGHTKSYGAGHYDFYLVKIDADGDTLWAATYGGSSGDYAQSVQQTADGGYVIAGWTNSFGAGMSDVYLVKTNADGDSLWTRAYGGSSFDAAWFIQQTTDGGYIVAGYTGSFGAGGNDAWLLKADANGDTLWTRTYGGSGYDYAQCVQQTTDSGYIIAGYTGSFGAGGNDVYLLKTDAVGDTLWTRTYGGALNDEAWCARQTADGGYIIAGTTMSFGEGLNDFYLVKTGADGDTTWARTYGGSLSEYGRSVQQTSDQGYIVTGTTESFGAGAYDVYLVRVAGETPEPHVTIEILPDNPPVTVPQGSSFGFTGTLTNNTEESQVVDAWTMAVGPQKDLYGPFKLKYDLELAPLGSLSGHFSQYVPYMAPLGFYNYIAYCGDYPSTVVDSSLFQIEVIAGRAEGAADWVLRGSFLEGDLVDFPSEFALLSNYPNPFNASTVISYELPTTSGVKLEVYNLSGQKVATLVDSPPLGGQSGYRSVLWDASEVSSGIYFYKLTAGDFTEIKPMTLLR